MTRIPSLHSAVMLAHLEVSLSATLKSCAGALDGEILQLCLGSRLCIPLGTFGPARLYRLVLTRWPSPDAKKEEFRQYLEKSGVIDALTKGEGCGPACRIVPLRILRKYLAGPGLASRDRCPLPAPHPQLRRVCRAVLVGLYEEPEKPANALE
eukprot:851202-Pleurochrysis_carterae.AAC.1